MPTCGPFLILSLCRALGTPRRQGLGSHCAHIVLACVFAFLIGKLDEIHVKIVRKSYEIRMNFT